MTTQGVTERVPEWTLGDRLRKARTLTDMTTREFALLSRALPEGWTGHTLRHRMASVSYAATRDLLAVGAVLGHSRPETTQRYVRMPDDALRAAVSAASAA